MQNCSNFTAILGSAALVSKLRLPTHAQFYLSARVTTVPSHESLFNSDASELHCGVAGFSSIVLVGHFATRSAAVRCIDLNQRPGVNFDLINIRE